MSTRTGAGCVDAAGSATQSATVARLATAAWVAVMLVVASACSSGAQDTSADVIDPCSYFDAQELSGVLGVTLLEGRYTGNAQGCTYLETGASGFQASAEASTVLVSVANRPDGAEQLVRLAQELAVAPDIQDLDSGASDNNDTIGNSEDGPRLAYLSTQGSRPVASAESQQSEIRLSVMWMGPEAEVEAVKGILAQLEQRFANSR